MAAKARLRYGRFERRMYLPEVHDASASGCDGLRSSARQSGEGAKFWGEGKARVDGECGINLSGGLIARAIHWRYGCHGRTMLHQLMGKMRGLR